MNKDLDIIFIGDSLTFGYGVHKTELWAYNVARELSLSYLNNACNGDTSTGILTRYYNDVIVHSPKTTFLMCGTNDLLMGKKIKSIIDNLEFMIKDSLSSGSQVVIGIPPFIIGEMAEELFSPSSFYKYTEESLPELRAQIISICNKFNVYYIDFYNLTLNNESLYLDGVHLNPEGHRIMFESFLSKFKDILL